MKVEGQRISTEIPNHQYTADMLIIKNGTTLDEYLKNLKYELYESLCKEIHKGEKCPCTNQTTSCLATFRVCDADSAIFKVIDKHISRKENE